MGMLSAEAVGLLAQPDIPAAAKVHKIIAAARGDAHALGFAESSRGFKSTSY
jgi:hypothetical protein